MKVLSPLIGLFASTIFLLGCAIVTKPRENELDYPAYPSILTYSAPEESGLIAVRPYPNPDDVCQVIAKNKLVEPLFTMAKTLIACPKHETGAIGDRRNEGARVLGQAKHWTVLGFGGEQM
ncbi:hypothetical protein N9A67_00635 [Rhodobacteraceae bacterium]|nr:hypothetical protein [Paracoccaceae bacterium]